MPLLVSLFTDCTANGISTFYFLTEFHSLVNTAPCAIVHCLRFYHFSATIEMIKIMQDYGEVVCCLGSSANCYNMPVFMQADARHVKTFVSMTVFF